MGWATGKSKAEADTSSTSAQTAAGLFNTDDEGPNLV